MLSEGKENEWMMLLIKCTISSFTGQTLQYEVSISKLLQHNAAHDLSVFYSMQHYISSKNNWKNFLFVNDVCLSVNPTNNN